ncbi:hypothetical protein [Nonomuraea sp. NPDC049480]
MTAQVSGTNTGSCTGGLEVTFAARGSTAELPEQHARGMLREALAFLSAD